MADAARNQAARGANSLVNQSSQQTDRKLRARNHPLYYHHLHPLFPAQVALFQVDEEGSEARTADERSAGKDEGDEAERPAAQRVTDGAVASDEGEQSARRLSAPPDSDAVPDCSLRRDYNFHRFSSVFIPLDSRPFGRRPDETATYSDGRVDAGAAIDYAGAFCRSSATQDDGGHHAAHDALYSLECARLTAGLLAGRQPRRLRSAGHH